MFRYGIDMVPRIEDRFLYHFTTAESLMKIVENMTLRLSSFTLLNDLNEDELNCERSGGMDVINIQNYIRENCRLICFTQNYKQDGHKFCQCGCNHPRLWAQYADNSKGACIVINEKEFLERNKELLEGKFYNIGDVAYSLLLYDKHIRTHENPEKFIQDNWEHLFYKKYRDWEQEHERRLFGIDLPDFLSIKGCIEFICVGRRFSNENLQKLVHLIVTPGYESYMQLTPHDFAKQQNSNGSAHAYDDSALILETVHQFNGDIIEYLKFLHEEGFELSKIWPEKHI